MLDQRDQFIRYFGLDRLDRRFLRPDFKHYIRPDAMRICGATASASCGLDCTSETALQRRHEN
jgi:hypothetical protein